MAGKPFGKLKPREEKWQNQFQNQVFSSRSSVFVILQIRKCPKDFTIYTGASGKSIIFPVFRKTHMEGFSVYAYVCVCVLEKLRAISKSLHHLEFISTNTCGRVTRCVAAASIYIQSAVYLISNPFLSPCSQTLTLCSWWHHTQTTPVFSTPVCS